MVFGVVTIKENVMETTPTNATDIKTVCKQRRHHLKAKRETKESLFDPKRFKATRQVRQSTLALLAENLEDYITANYLLVRRRVNEKTVKTYVFLVLRNFANPDWIRRLVHRIVPLIETDVNCTESDCTCKACASSLVRGIRRRGFGYIKEVDLEKTVEQLMQQGFTCSLRGLPPTKRQRRALRSRENNTLQKQCWVNCYLNLQLS